MKEISASNACCVTLRGDKVVASARAAGSQVLGIRHEAPVVTCAAVSAHEPRTLAVAETDSGASVSLIDIGRGADALLMLRVKVDLNGRYIALL